ncbi:transglycosylase SLT domain-containing protein [Streptomyces sp. NPDC004822]
MVDDPLQSGGAVGRGSNAAVTAAAATGLGCLASPVALVGGIVVVIIIGGLGVLLAPIIALILLFTGGGSGSTPDVSPDEISSVVQGDGKGELARDTVPTDVVDAILDAGALCPGVGPVVIASQIQQESGFDSTVVGPNGEVGLSQLPPSVFEEFGEDDDSNGAESPLDATDSILAQGRFMCSLIDQTEPLASEGRPLGDALSLALAAYDVGLDAVRLAGGVPRTDQSQTYVVGVRALFARFQGLVPGSGPLAGVSSVSSPSIDPTISPEGR